MSVMNRHFTKEKAGRFPDGNRSLLKGPCSIIHDIKTQTALEVGVS